MQRLGAVSGRQADTRRFHALEYRAPESYRSLVPDCKPPRRASAKAYILTPPPLTVTTSSAPISYAGEDVVVGGGSGASQRNAHPRGADTTHTAPAAYVARSAQRTPHVSFADQPTPARPGDSRAIVPYSAGSATLARPGDSRAIVPYSAGSAASKKTSIVCRDFLSGRCSYGPACKYAHVRDDSGRRDDTPHRR
jgi:hypothetical protein